MIYFLRIKRSELILKRVSKKGLKLAFVSKKDRILSKAKGIQVKTKVGYENFNIDQKVQGARKASMSSFQNFIKGFKTVLFKPVRQVSHFGLVLVVLIVLSTGIPAPRMNKEVQKEMVDPFGITAMSEATHSAGDKVAAVEAVATVVSVIDTSKDEKMIKEAYAVADAQAAKSNMILAGDSIAKMAFASTTTSASGKAEFEKYVVLNGDTLWSIARKFGITTDSIKWSNKMTDEDFVKPGQELLIPSITGIIYTVKAGDTIEGIASRYKSSASMIISQNDLYGDGIKVGMTLIIPDGTIDEPVPAPATPVPSRTRIAGSRGSVPSYVSASAGPNRFPWGYCTWWVAHKRYIPWRGNAWQWYGNARAYGRSVGRTPVRGAVMVTWESSVGHVAYVESVNGSTFTVSEMNYVGYGRVSSRTITTSQVPLIGFIY